MTQSGPQTPNSLSIQYLVDHPEVVIDRVGNAPFTWRVDAGYLEAAQLEGCSHARCHACEEPIEVGETMTWSQLDRMEPISAGLAIAAAVHWSCREMKPIGPAEWRKKYGRRPESPNN
jgi:hypothetical protein